MKFSYQYFEGQKLPIVPLKIKGTSGWLEFNVYIDTGASYSLFPADAAEIIGLELEKGDLTEMTVGDGNHIQVYIHNLPLSLAGKEFIARIGFSKGLGVGFYIMGRKDIFDKFIVCLYYFTILKRFNYILQHRNLYELV
ncbi:hypothetical protein J4437_04280 [Candidatus Woesearchaeota archaeon]|nr:hypothetical protein [Candidatus Woesearchaeota archaeon]